MTDTSLSYAMRNVPRYTSYPTAPHFNTGVDGTTYAGWLADLSSANSLSLYLHVPFCRDICHYCGCHTKATRRDEPLHRYAQTLLKELELVGNHIKEAGPVKHIHWGGGTPSLLPEQNLADLTSMMRVIFDFDPALEHAIELDPRHVSASLASTLASMGVNRASLGVQDINAKVQDAIGRVQPFAVVQDAVSSLRTAGLSDLNFDLMYGLPHQTLQTIRETVARTVELSPSRIALFGYAHVPWMKKHQRLIPEAILPTSAERMELAEAARADLQSAGYQPIGLDHFALPEDTMAIAAGNGTLRRNFQGYTTDQGEQLLGFGVSSIGRLSKGYVQNISDVGHWRRAVEAGQLPVAKGMALSKDDLFRGRIIEALMTDYACDLGALAATFGDDPNSLTGSIDRLGDLLRDELVELDGWHVRVPKRGRPFVRLVAAAFDAYLDGHSTGTKRHSLAV